MIAHKVKLTKIESNHNNLRTNEIEGVSLDLPEVGKSFYLVGESLTEGMDARVVTTTEIKSLEKTDNEYTFKTLNSTYKLEVLGTEEIE